ncbi:MAG: putative transcriptional regulator [Actinomycetia bacterium]|nr:putative transcriptional regulator [Actinomycetes bacterium]
MIGRDDELHSIQSVLNAAQDGRGGAVFVAGEAGIGKSRLAAAAADLGFAAGMCIMRGRGSAIAPMVPFRSLTEALMSLMRSRQAIDITAIGPYGPILARLVPDWGTPSPGEDGGSLVVLAEGVLRLTALAGREGGCLLILDDLQDSDAETLAVIEYLTDNLAAQPTVLLGTVRAGPSPALDLAKAVTRRGSSVLLGLQRLAKPDVRELAGSWLGCAPADVPAEVAEYVWAGSSGVPLIAEELLEEALSSGLLVQEATGWRLTGTLRHRISTTLARTISGRLDLIGPHGRELLSLAAVLGQRFPVALLRAASGMQHRELLSQLHDDITSQFVAPDEETPDWYSFHHSLIVDVILSLLTAERRRELAARAAKAVEVTYPGFPGEWCQVAAAFLLQAGDPAGAGELFAEAGRRAFHLGAASSAVTLLDKALELLATDGDARIRADAFATQLYALVEAGQVERVMTSAAELEHVAGVLDPTARARLHTRLAWAAMVGGRPREGLAQVDVARRLLGPGAADQDSAPVDIVQAHLTLDVPGPGQVREAERLARRAAAAAEAAHEPEVACQAWQLLGALTRSRDPEEATACLEQARQLAVRHRLPIEEIHALIRLGNDDALRDGSLDRLEQVRAQATRVGAVTTRYQAEASIALQAILRADFATAEELLDQVLAPTMRLRLLETTRYALLLRAILAAHRARRNDMDAAFAELRRWEGDHAQHTPRAHGLARAWCALLEENRPRALRELSLALAAEQKSSTIFQLTGRYGVNLLLRVLDGQADRAEFESITATRASQLRWDRQFAMFAHAILAGRAGRAEDAARSVAEAIQLAAPYPTGGNIGLRLVSEAAIADGWGTPADWLRTAEEYFHDHEIPAVASACRSLLRRTGTPVSQRRRGIEDIPASLRTVNVTVREYEILCLLVDRLSNREIAARLHLSPRTVEKHVASLLMKTAQPDRIALADFAAAMLR